MCRQGWATFLAERTQVTQRQPRLHDEGYLAFLRKQPCCVCHAHAPCDAAHVKSASHAHGKPSSGTAKPDDKWCVPLCRSCHLLQHHAGNEMHWWRLQDKNPFTYAINYYAEYGGAGGEPKKSRVRKKREPRDQRKAIQTDSQRWRKSLRMASKYKRKVSGEVVLR